MSVLNTFGVRGRNKIINGNFDIWQRGTSFSATGSSTAYTADRWQLVAGNSATGTITVAQSSVVPTIIQSGFSSSYSLLLGVSGADTSLTGSEIYYTRQKIEGYNVVDLLNKKITISFWTKSNKAGDYGVSLTNGNVDSSYVTYFTVSSGEAASQTWVKRSFVIDMTGAELLGSGWNWTNGIGLILTIVLATADSKTSNLNVWKTDSSLRAPTTQVNFMDSVANVLYISQAQLKEGEYSNPAFERAGIDIANELMLCQRYYEVLNSGLTAALPAYGQGTTNGRATWWFKVPKRAATAGLIIAGSHTADYRICSPTALISPNASMSRYTSTTECIVINVPVAAITDSACATFLFYNSYPTAYFAMDAEL